MKTSIAIMVVAAVLLVTHPAAACPFCGVVGESLARRRDAAAAVVVGEAEGPAAPDAAGVLVQRFRLHQPLRGEPGLAGRTVAARVGATVKGTAILFCEAPAGESPVERGRWSAVAADEAVLGHVAAAPAVREPAARRLEWFAARLEHPEPLIAEDAFVEFGAASFEAVRSAAAALDADRLRDWVAEPGIDQRRRGFYGLALGIVAGRPGDPSARRACIASLHVAVEAPADDFRAGFDGLLAGILVAEGEAGLDYLERRGLFGSAAADAEGPQPAVRPVDQRHLLAALRFAWENLADTIPRQRTAAATARLLSSPAVAADAAVDLARYQAWDAVDGVANLWQTLGAEDAVVRRAVAGYLTACPLPAARLHLDRIRAADPDRLRAAIESAGLPRGL